MTDIGGPVDGVGVVCDVGNEERLAAWDERKDVDGVLGCGLPGDVDGVTLAYVAWKEEVELRLYSLCVEAACIGGVCDCDHL